MVGTATYTEIHFVYLQTYTFLQFVLNHKNILHHIPSYLHNNLSETRSIISMVANVHYLFLRHYKIS